MAALPTMVPPDLGKVKAAIHRWLISKLNLDRVTQLNRDTVRAEVAPST